MANIIAVIWDFDKTLIDGYMQDPIFKEYGVDAANFWAEGRQRQADIAKKGIRINEDTYYLNHFLHSIKEGTFKGLNNEKLRQFGKEQHFYPGVLDLFDSTTSIVKDNEIYSEYGIQVEHYIVSTGFAEVIRGSALAGKVKGIWGCELLDAEVEPCVRELSEVVYTIDHTTKTRAIFEINKGKEVAVNSKIDKEFRRVRFENMIYVGDGPSDIPAFSLVKQNGGSTFAIYPKGDGKAFRQVNQMRQDGRVDHFAEADYSEDTNASLWIHQTITDVANRIVRESKNKVNQALGDVPRHLV